MLDNLLMTLPEARHAALALELNLLDRTLEKLALLPEDFMLARKPFRALAHRCVMRGCSVKTHDVAAPCAIDSRPHMPRRRSRAGSLRLGRIARSNSMRIPGRRDCSSLAPIVLAVFWVVPCASAASLGLPITVCPILPVLRLRPRLAPAPVRRPTGRRCRRAPRQRSARSRTATAGSAPNRPQTRLGRCCGRD
jgi:hypothetical protein